MAESTHFLLQAMHSNWESIEGRQVGSWRLISFFGERDGKALFLTTHIAGGDERLMEIVEVDGREASDLEASWKRAKEIAEPHLLSVYAIDQDEIDCEAVQFAVFDLPDDDLGEMIGRRAFEPTEARTAFTAVARGLEALHKRGLQHGTLTPPNIFLVNGAYRLSVDSIAPAGESGIEEDLRQLGATLVQAMMGTAISGVADAPAAVDRAARLDQPFHDIAVGCLNNASNREWTADRVLEALSDRVGREHTKAVRPVRQWIAAAMLGVVLLAALYFVASRKTSHASEQDKPMQAVARDAAPQPRSEERVSDPVSPEPARRTPTPIDRHTVLAEKRGSWGVIAATYTSFHAAQRRAEAIEKRTRKLHASVLPQDPQGKYFYVVLGSGLTEDAAAQLRRHAIARGAPGDTYVTKLDERTLSERNRRN